MSKIKIHVRNNHWKEGFLPSDKEGEKHSTITNEEFERGLEEYPEIKDKIEYLVDWDEDKYLSSMKEADILLGWQFPTKNIRAITPNLIITPHISSDSQGNYIEMVLKIFFKNLKLFIENKDLINQIDRKLGY